MTMHSQSLSLKRQAVLKAFGVSTGYEEFLVLLIESRGDNFANSMLSGFYIGDISEERYLHILPYAVVLLSFCQNGEMMGTHFDNIISQMEYGSARGRIAESLNEMQKESLLDLISCIEIELMGCPSESSEAIKNIWH